MKIQTRVYRPAVILAGLMLSACAHLPTLSGADKSETAAKSQSGKAHWTYSGEHGPEHWASLSEAFSTCDKGRLQSPFNIEADIGAYLAGLGLNYHSVPMKIINNGHTIQVDMAGGGTLNVDGKSYNLLQFHFHAGSEYAIDGKTYPLEMHLVHASDSGELAVVGVMFEEGPANAELANIWSNMPASEGEAVVAGKSVTVSKLLPESRKYYRFMGSLTTPPCSEGVNWHMMSQPMTASAEQIAQFTAIYPMNARPLQDENNRLVVLGK